MCSRCFPRPAPGRLRLDDRMAPNRIAWRFRTGVAWRDVPEPYGSRAGLSMRFHR
ncbi:transposase [Streptomyces sp. NBC_01233]|uniref:transposase n=1 Tax=Streptomyces sp. NBC_01233 TaxID=2903787 RepID=UPI003FA3B509